MEIVQIKKETFCKIINSKSKGYQSKVHYTQLKGLERNKNANRLEEKINPFNNAATIENIYKIILLVSIP